MSLHFLSLNNECYIQVFAILQQLLHSQDKHIIYMHTKLTFEFNY